MAAHLESAYLLLRLPGHIPVLVLGMSWHTVIGSRLEQRARQRARQTGATHWAHDGRSEAVGAVRLARADRGSQAAALHSAALVFAAEHRQGMAALCARLPDGRAWVVASQGGKVLTQSDRIHASIDDALDALEDLRARYGEGLALHGLEEDGPFDFTAMTEQARDAQRLRPCGLALPAVPRPLAVAILAGAMAFAGREGWQRYRASAHVAPSLPVVDAEAAWASALDAYGRGVRLQTKPVWTQVLRSLAGLPVEAGGWRLQSAQCRVASPGWNCDVRYQRASRKATNTSFAAARPQGWLESWQPMEGVVGHFVIENSAFRPLSPDGLGHLADHERLTVTALQELLPALSRVVWGDAAPVRIEPPRAADGSPVPRPPDLPAISERPLAVEGPLRSLFLLPEALSGQIEWRSVTLAIEDSASPSLNRSRLMAGMSGVLYARD